MSGEILTTRDVAEIVSAEFGPPSVLEWQIRRLFEAGDLPEPQRFGHKRMIQRASLPAIVEALRARGWLNREAAP